MISRNRAFEIPLNGLAIEDGPLIIGGSSSPELETTDGPTVFFQSNGDIWVNPGGSSWTKNGSGGGNPKFDYFNIRTNEFIAIEQGQSTKPTHLELDGCLTIDGCMGFE